MDVLLNILWTTAFVFGGLTGLWLLFKYKVETNLTDAAKGLAAVAKMIGKIIFKGNKTKQKKYNKHIEFILTGVLAVERSKKEIKERMRKEGWDENDKSKLYDEYSKEAIDIARELGTHSGIAIDDMNEKIMKVVIKIFLQLFVRKNQPETDDAADTPIAESNLAG